MRSRMVIELRKLIEMNPLLNDKLQFPTMMNSRLKRLINQSCSLNWNNEECLCDFLKRATIDQAPHVITNAPMMSSIPKVNNHPVKISHANLPMIVVANMNQGSTVQSMDFHPLEQTLLLVGTYVGDVALWELGVKEQIAFKSFNVWGGIGWCSMALRDSLANGYATSINRVKWSPEGTMFGIAYSKHIVHLYYYLGREGVQEDLQIDAHDGSVNDLAFLYMNDHLYVITCGEDKFIRVWDARTGALRYNLKGHEAPVYSMSLYQLCGDQYILATAVDGKLKAWLLDDVGFEVDCDDGPGHSYTTLAHSADGTRFFTCSTSNDGKSSIMEWDANQGIVKRSYLGLAEKSVGLVQFDMARDQILAAGDQFAVKFWDMDDVNLVAVTHAGGGLPGSPCIRFNKEGTLLAVSTCENGFKILANADGIRLISAVFSGKVIKASATKHKIVPVYLVSPGTCAAESEASVRL